MKRIIIPSLLALLSVGCKTTEPEVVPVNYSQLENIKSVALINVEGDHEKLSNKTVNDSLSNYFSNFRVSGDKRFDVVADGPADALLGGNYSVSVKSKSNTRRSKQCMQKVTRNEDDGLPGEKMKTCAVWRTAYTICSNKTTVVEFTPKVLSATDGSVIFSKTYKASRSLGRSCVGRGGNSLKLPQSLMAKTALDSVLKAFFADIAPYFVEKSIVLPATEEDKSGSVNAGREVAR